MDRLGAELGDITLADFLLNPEALLFGYKPTLTGSEQAVLLTETDCKESASSSSSSPDDATEPLLCELNLSRS